MTNAFRTKNTKSQEKTLVELALGVVAVINSLRLIDYNVWVKTI